MLCPVLHQPLKGLIKNYDNNNDFPKNAPSENMDHWSKGFIFLMLFQWPQLFFRKLGWMMIPVAAIAVSGLVHRFTFT